MQGDRRVGEEPEVLRGPRGLAAGLGDGEPGVERLEFGDPWGAGLDVIRDPVQDLRPVAGRHLRPRAVGERGGGGGDGPVHVVGGAGRHRGVRLVAHRVGDLERGPVRASGGLAGDEVLEFFREPGWDAHVCASGSRWAVMVRKIIYEHPSPNQARGWHARLESRYAIRHYPD